MKLVADVDVRGTIAGLRRQGVAIQRRAIPRALNRTIDSVKGRAAREIRDRLKGIFKLADVRRRLRVSRAMPITLTAAVTAVGAKRISLAAFKPVQTKTGVRVRFGQASALIPHAFLIRGRRGVFVRASDFRAQLYDQVDVRRKRVVPSGSDLPISLLVAPSVPLAFIERAITAQMERTTLERFPIELAAAARSFGGR